MEKNDYEYAADLFRVLAHPTRLRILAELHKGKKCVTSIQELVGARQANVSQHLSLLRLQGIVDCCSTGKTKCYFLNENSEVERIVGILKLCQFV